MPTYDYRCEVNDTVVEVRHAMSHRIMTWGELCDTAGIDPGETEEIAPVSRLANGGNVVRSATLRNSSPAGCDAGDCCGGCPMAG